MEQNNGRESGTVSWYIKRVIVCKDSNIAKQYGHKAVLFLLLCFSNTCRHTQKRFALRPWKCQFPPACQSSLSCVLEKKEVSWVLGKYHASLICHQLKCFWAYRLKGLEILKHTCRLVPDIMLIYFIYIYHQVLKTWFSFSFFNIFSKPFLFLLSHPVLWEMLALGISKQIGFASSYRKHKSYPFLIHIKLQFTSKHESWKASWRN